MSSAIVIATAVASFVGLLLSGTALGAPDEALLGKAEGYPVCRLDDANIGPNRCPVGLFSHFDEAYPARKVERGGPMHKLERAESRTAQYWLFYATLRAVRRPN